MPKMLVPSNSQKYQWLGTIETLSVIGSIGGAIASVVVKEVALASIPLSASVLLNIVNRRMLIDSTKHDNLAMLTQVVEENLETQNKLETLTEQLAELEQIKTKKHAETQANLTLLNEQLQQLAANFSRGQQLNNQEIAQLKQEKGEIEEAIAQVRQEKGKTEEAIARLGQEKGETEEAIAQIRQEKGETEAKLGMLSQQLEQLQQLTEKLSQARNNQLLKEQEKIARTVDALREIETCTQSIQINPISSANAFFNRGLSYQNLGDREAAIRDYTEAIRANPHYAEAYQRRGLIYADLEDKKTAVRDLREAARLFFESGELDQYQMARELSKKLHELDSPTVTDTSTGVTLESLFST